MESAPEDTIVAPITASFGGAVQVLRISGAETKAVLSKVLSQSVPVIENPRELFLRKFIDENKQALDEGLVSYFAGPASYTGEDIAEFHLHASPYICLLYTSPSPRDS